MKKLLTLLAAAMLVLASCGTGDSSALPQGGKGSGIYETVQTALELDGGSGVLSLVADAYHARANAAYKETAFVQLKATAENPEGDRIVALSATENKASLLFKGNMIGIFGDVLVAVDDEGYHALDLEKGDQWVELAPETLHYNAIQNGDQVYLFALVGEGEEARTKVLTLDLNTLQTTAKELSAVYLPMALAGNRLYYITPDGALAAADPATSAVETLHTPEKYPLTDLYASGKLLLLRDRYGHTHMYHTETNQLTNLSERHSAQRATIHYETKDTALRLTLPDQSTVYYNNQTGEEAAPSFDFDQWFPLPDGFYTYDPGTPNYSIDSKAAVQIGEYTMDLLYQTTPLMIHASPQCGVFEQEGYVAVVHWETESQQVYKNEDLTAL